MKKSAIKSRFNETKNTAIKVAKENSLNSNRASIVYLLALAVIFWNFIEADSARFAFAQTAQGGYLNINPVTANKILKSIDQYTPVLEEEHIDLGLVYDPELRGGFASADNIEERLTTKESDLEIEYKVKGGDTLLAIAKEHNSTVATLMEHNKLDLNGIENLKLGAVIKIPPKITSDSTKWLEDLEAKRAKERSAAISATRTAVGGSTQRSSVGYGSVSSRNLAVPIRYKYISRGLLRYHHGIDYVANTGTPVMAAQNGRVIEITRGWAGGFGTSILVDHGGGLTTRYAHLSSVLIGIGQNVSKGQQIGLSGNTGNSTGPHLHFETKLNGRPIYPY